MNGQQRKSRQRERESGETFPPFKSVSYLSTDNTHSPEGRLAKDQLQSHFCPTFTDAKLESKLNLLYEKAAITAIVEEAAMQRIFQVFLVLFNIKHRRQRISLKT